MIPRVLVLVSGERIIAGLSEVTDDDGKGVCLVVRCPYILNMIPTEELNDEGAPAQFTINFAKWLAYSSSDEFRIPYSSVIAIGEAEESILDVYMKRFGDKLNAGTTDDGGDAGDNRTSDSSDSAEEPGVSDSAD